MQNGLNESFWDGLGVEIGACANFDPKTLFWGSGKKIVDTMLWGIAWTFGPTKGGSKMWIFLKNSDFLECRDKRSEFGLGSAFFGISDLGFLPYGVPIKGVIEKGWIFDEKPQSIDSTIFCWHPGKNHVTQKNDISGKK